MRREKLGDGNQRLGTWCYILALVDLSENIGMRFDGIGWDGIPVFAVMFVQTCLFVNCLL